MIRRKVGWAEFFPVTWWIILVTAGAFVLQVIAMLFDPEIIKYLALQPVSILQGRYLWTLVTHMFFHGNFLHLFVNMFALFSLGGLCEKIIGRKRFFWLYLLSGVFAGVLSVLLSGFYGSSTWGARVFGSPEMYMVGASGALFAVAGLFVVLLPRIRFSIIFLPFFSLPAYIMVPLLLVIMWLGTIAANLPIGNTAHFGGFLIGLGYGWYLRAKYRRKVEMLDRYFRRH